MIVFPPKTQIIKLLKLGMKILLLFRLKFLKLMATLAWCYIIESKRITAWFKHPNH